jgi:lincosamide nucleotidyltransferase A/C/D/E
MAMLDTRDVLVILDQLDRAGLVVWLDGGWGVDALLGRRSRHHRDLDLVIARHDCAVAREALAGLGFRHDLGLLAERFGVAVPPAIEAPAGDHRPDRSSGTP